ncbi:MAG: thiol-disulfide oxidoreductase DCC family protein [Ignavibacteria bacterium]
MENHKIILFDGVCNLCNASINFIIDRDKKNIFKFAALQSDSGRRILEKFGLDVNDFHSVILVEDEKYYTRSSAALRILKDLGSFWQILYGFIIFPPPVRDFFYNILSSNRYKLFGKKDSCRIPTPELKKKFL